MAPAHQLVNQDSGIVEWYTPSAIVAAARRCMGGIDLDPASCAAANGNVSASRYYTVDDNGLSQAWSGRVWLNHPYSRDGNALWIQKLCASYEGGQVTQACAIVNASTSEKWFQPLFSYPLCFIVGRLKFTPGSGQPQTSATKGSVVAYLGPRVDRFAAEFSPLGRLMIPYRIPDTKCAICSSGFTAKRADAVYCSAACKQRAIRQHSKQART